MTNDQSNFKNFGDIQRDSEKVLGDHFWKDFTKMIPQKAPPIDIVEDGEKGYIFIELPGITSKDNITLSFQGQNLVIEGAIPKLYPDKDCRVLHQERITGHIKRSIVVPFPFQINTVSASYENGILLLTIDKTKEHFNIPFTISKK